MYAVYFVLSWNQPMDVQHRIGEGVAARATGRVLLPAWLYLRGTAMVLFTSSRPMYLLGTTYPHGLPVYFPLLLVWKSTPGFLALLAASAGGALVWRRSGAGPLVPASERVLWRVLWLSCVVFSAVCLLSRLNISFRHFTIPLALMLVMLSVVPRAIGVVRARRRGAGSVLAVVTVLLALSSVVSAVAAYPDFLPYTNG